MNDDDQKVAELRDYYRDNFATGDSDKDFLDWVRRVTEQLHRDREWKDPALVAGRCIKCQGW